MVTIRTKTAFGRSRQRLALTVVISLTAHLGVAALTAGLGGAFSVPSPDITWLDLENTLGAPAPPPKKEASPKPRHRPPPPKKKPPRPPQPKRAQAPKPKPAPVAEALPPDAGPSRDAGLSPTAQRPSDAGAPEDQSPAPPFTVEQTAIANISPGDAALILLLRMDRIRGSPYADAVRRLLMVFYDHKTILWSSGLDPVADFQALIIATPNPYRVIETFLAARHQLPLGRLRRALTRAASFEKKRPRWRRQDGRWLAEIPSPPKLSYDTRKLVLDQQVVMLTKPEHIDLLNQPLNVPGVDAGPQAPTWLEQLGAMETQGGVGKEGPGMLLQAENLPRLVRLPRDLPTPVSLQVTVSSTAPAQVSALITFSNEGEARQFNEALPRRLETAKRSIVLRLLGVAALLDAIAFRREAHRIFADATMTQEQVEGLLEVFGRMIPQVSVPGMPPRLPPDAGLSPDMSRPPDAGVPLDQGVSPDTGPRSEAGHLPQEGLLPDLGRRPNGGFSMGKAGTPEAGGTPDPNGASDASRASDAGRVQNTGGTPDASRNPDAGGTPDAAVSQKKGRDLGLNQAAPRRSPPR